MAWRRVSLVFVVLTVVVIAGAKAALPPLAHASDPSRLVAPAPDGPVDFGDRVAYRLEGPSCDGETARVIVRAGAANKEVDGAQSTARPDPLAASPACTGVVVVPTESAVRKATGWDQGDPIAISVVSGTGQVALRYERVEVGLGKAVAGSPTFVTPQPADPRGGRREKTVQMNSGDAVDIGRVDLTKIYSVSVRVCIPSGKPHAPTEFSLRTGSPTGPRLVGPVDIADDYLNDWKSIDGWPNCWQLLPWPITGEAPARAPELYVTVDTAPEPVLLSWIDFNGTGAKLPDVPAQDPASALQIFNGASFSGWTQTGCALDDEAAHTAHASDTDMGGCTMTYSPSVHNVMLRLEYRQQDFESNGGIMMPSEIQMREPGEWLTGGFLGDNITPSLTNGAVDNSGGGYPAQRIKSNSWPDWNEMEIVQLGAHYVVRINGRTVTDYVAPAGDPKPYNLQLVTQPVFSYQYGVNGRFDTTTWNPTITTPASWGNLWYKNVRLYQCTSVTDPVCTSGAGVNG
jgi:hypothetical protein